MKLYGFAKQYHEERKNDPNYITSGIVIEVLDNLARLMEERSIGKKLLARRMGKSERYVTKLLSRCSDLSIRDLVTLALAIGERPEKLRDLADLFGDGD